MNAAATVLPDLTTILAPNLTLTSPFVAAAGTLGWGDEIADMADMASWGALITPTLTLEPRRGNPMPRTAEASAGLIHSTGLPNPGLSAFLTDRLPVLQKLPCPVIVSIAGETPQELTRLASELTAAGGIAALELNLTPFSLLLTERTTDLLPTETELLATLAAQVAAVRAATNLPLLAKLPPILAETGRAAQAAERAGADVISVSQAFPAVAVRASSLAFRFPGVVGGLSGPAIKPLALYQVWRAAQSISVPILGGGGVMTADDALEFLLTGATGVTVGTANLVHPNAIARLKSDFIALLSTHQIPAVSSLIGRA